MDLHPDGTLNVEEYPDEVQCLYRQYGCYMHMYIYMYSCIFDNPCPSSTLLKNKIVRNYLQESP